MLNSYLELYFLFGMVVIFLWILIFTKHQGQIRLDIQIITLLIILLAWPILVLASIIGLIRIIKHVIQKGEKHGKGSNNN